MFFASTNSFKTYYPDMKIDPVSNATYLPCYIATSAAAHIYIGATKAP